MATWTSKPRILSLIEQLQLLTLRLERLALKTQLDRTQTLLNAQKAMLKK